MMDIEINFKELLKKSFTVVMVVLFIATLMALYYTTTACISVCKDCVRLNSSNVVLPSNLTKLNISDMDVNSAPVPVKR